MCGKKHHDDRDMSAHTSPIQGELGTSEARSYSKKQRPSSVGYRAGTQRSTRQIRVKGELVEQGGHGPTSPRKGGQPRADRRANKTNQFRVLWGKRGYGKLPCVRDKDNPPTKSRKMTDTIAAKGVGDGQSRTKRTKTMAQ